MEDSVRRKRVSIPGYKTYTQELAERTVTVPPHYATMGFFSSRKPAAAEDTTSTKENGPTGGDSAFKSLRSRLQVVSLQASSLRPTTKTMFLVREETRLEGARLLAACVCPVRLRRRDAVPAARHSYRNPSPRAQAQAQYQHPRPQPHSPWSFEVR